MAKRYYKKLTRFPEGIDRLESEVRLPIDEEQIAGFLESYFLGGNMKPMVGYLILKYGLWEEAMNLGMTDSQQIAFRATWALEWAYSQSYDELPEWFADRMVDDFVASRNGSLHRVYSKMLCDMIRFGGFTPSERQAERLTEKCFDLATEPQTRVAVKFWCLDTLCELAPRIDWIPEALEGILQRLSEEADCPPGMVVACREIGKRLRKQKKG